MKICSTNKANQFFYKNETESLLFDKSKYLESVYCVISCFSRVQNTRRTR